jgi:transcriptional regulator with XRE-family HTH domain
MTTRPTQADPPFPDPDPGKSLALHVRAWRLRLQPEMMPGLLHGRSGGRRRRHVSQEQIAMLVGCSTHWYSRLELGIVENYSDDFLQRVGRVLRLSPEEMTLLFLLTTGKEPATPTRLPVLDGLEGVLEGQPWPAYLSNEAWDIIGHNAQMEDWFPWVVQKDANVMRWVFTYADARQQLVRWDTDWAMPMLAQMRIAQARYPNNQRLREVIAEVLECNRDARNLWERPMAYLHPDGDRRALYLPRHAEPQPVQIVALEPLRAPGSRLVMLAPA